MTDHARTIASIGDQVVPLEKYFTIYVQLFGQRSDWRNVVEGITVAEVKGKKKRTISRSALTRCSVASERGPDNLAALFIMAMIWGYGEHEDAGAFRLFSALRSGNFKAQIEQSADLVRQSRLADALIEIQRVAEIGFSYASKWLYAVDLAYAGNERAVALVLDSRIMKRLASPSMCGPDAQDRYCQDLWYYTPRQEEAAKGYAVYCKDMHEWATKLDPPCSPRQIEQFLFTARRQQR